MVLLESILPWACSRVCVSGEEIRFLVQPKNTSRAGSLGGSWGTKIWGTSERHDWLHKEVPGIQWRRTYCWPEITNSLGLSHHDLDYAQEMFLEPRTINQEPKHFSTPQPNGNLKIFVTSSRKKNQDRSWSSCPQG